MNCICFPHIHLESVGQGSAMVSSSAPSVFSVQALALLAEVVHYCTVISLDNIQETHNHYMFSFLQILAPLLDMVYRSDEKEKAVPLISRLMYYVFPYLKNHR